MSDKLFRSARVVEHDFTACQKCSDAQLVEVFLGRDHGGNAIAHCHMCGHDQVGTVREVRASDVTAINHGVLK